MSIWSFFLRHAQKTPAVAPTFTVHLTDPIHPHSFSFELTREQAGFLQCIYLAYEPGPGAGQAQIGISFIRDEAPFAAGQSSDQLPANNTHHLFWLPSLRPSSTPNGLVKIFTIPKDLELLAGDTILFVTSKTGEQDKFKYIFLTMRLTPGA